MLIIPKGKASFIFKIEESVGRLYCFLDLGKKTLYDFNYDILKQEEFGPLSNITVNERNEVHSYNKNPAFVYKNFDREFQGIYCKNGIFSHSIPIKDSYYCTFLDLAFSELKIIKEKNEII